ncbi:unnamed protein product, partial [Ectocarpus fasciculatus]
TYQRDPPVRLCSRKALSHVLYFNVQTTTTTTTTFPITGNCTRLCTPIPSHRLLGRSPFSQATWVWACLGEGLSHVQGSYLRCFLQPPSPPPPPTS